MDYFSLLNEAYEQLSKIERRSIRERFEPPLPKIAYEKNFTILLNAKDIADYLNRDLEHLMRFLKTEFNVPCKIEGGQIMIQKKLSFEQLKEKINKYIREFVLCPVCKKPDTVLIKKERITYIKCLVCGAESPVLYKLK